MLVSFLISIIGFFIFKYELEKVFYDFGLTEDAQFSVILSILFGTLIFIFRYHSCPEKIWMYFVFLFFLSKIMPLFLIKKYESEMQNEIIVFVDNVLLSVQSGMSLKISLDKALEIFHGWKKVQFKILIRSIYFSQNADKLRSNILRKFQSEIATIEKSKIKIIEQLKSYRNQLKLEQDLRHRSRQITMNLKIQSFIMTLLYFFVAAFVYSNFDTSKSIKVIAFSSLIFVVGLVAVFYIGKGMKWKV